MLNTSSLLTAVFLVFFCLIMVPLDGIEHAYTKDEKLKRQKDYGEPINPTRIRHLNTFKTLHDMICHAQRYIKVAASTTCRIDAALSGLGVRMQLDVLVYRQCGRCEPLGGKPDERPR